MQNDLYWYSMDHSTPSFDQSAWLAAVREFRDPVFIVRDTRRSLPGVSQAGAVTSTPMRQTVYPLVAMLPGSYPEWLGGRAFQAAHRVRFAYVGGAMARGITSVDLVIALAKSGMLAFFGAAGLSLDAVRAALQKFQQALDPLNLPYGSNLIHSPDQPALEQATVELYLQQNVRRISASAFMALSKYLVWYACSGLRHRADGGIQRHNHVFAKISHPTVARHFMSPPPQAMLNELVTEGRITHDEAVLARRIPVAGDITVEADSGGHTDNRPLTALFPRIQILRDELSHEFDYTEPIRLGAAGGLGTPTALAAAYGMGADYVLIGSVHQAAIESGMSTLGKQKLAAVDIDDMMMTSAADMFEMGVKVQVLKKGTMQGVRGNQLYELYRTYHRMEDIPDHMIAQLEKNVFRMPISAVWDQTVAHFNSMDPRQIQKASVDPKHKMALIFRWYLSHSSRWPLTGQEDRQLDYQIWCGPAMGAFNTWTKNSFLEEVENRTVRQIALNLLEGAATVTRANQLRSLGVSIPTQAFYYQPKPLTIQ